MRQRLPFLILGFLVLGCLATLGCDSSSQENEAPEPNVPQAAQPDTHPIGSSVTTTGRGAGCLTEQAFSEATNAVSQGDHRDLEYLERSGQCIAVGPGFKASLLDRSLWNGWVKIRVYTNAGAAVLYATPSVIGE